MQIKLMHEVEAGMKKVSKDLRKIDKKEEQQDKNINNQLSKQNENLNERLAKRKKRLRKKSADAKKKRSENEDDEESVINKKELIEAKQELDEVVERFTIRMTQKLLLGAT